MNAFPMIPQHENWLLDPLVKYLNHGSFGARTDSIANIQQDFRVQFEASPVDFLDRLVPDLLCRSRTAVAELVQLDGAGIGFVDNATTGIAAAIHSIELKETDEIVTTNHVYNGVRQLLIQRARAVQCAYKEVEIPFPTPSTDEMTTLIKEACTERTKVLVLDHVSSPTAVVFPIRPLIEFCKQQEILILIDGAHAPGMLPFTGWAELPDWYVGNLHKWICAPLGAAFIWTAPQHRSTTHPLTISHFLDQGYTEEFDWQGTRDFTAWVTVFAAIEAHLHKTADTGMAVRNEMARWINRFCCESFGVPSMYAEESQIGSMVTIALPDGSLVSDESCLAFRDHLYSDHHIEIPVFLFENKPFARVSAQNYVQEAWIGSFVETIQSELMPQMCQYCKKSKKKS